MFNVIPCCTTRLTPNEPTRFVHLILNRSNNLCSKRYMSKDFAESTLRTRACGSSGTGDNEAAFGVDTFGVDNDAFGVDTFGVDIFGVDGKAPMGLIGEERAWVRCPPTNGAGEETLASGAAALLLAACSYFSKASGF